MGGQACPDRSPARAEDSLDDRGDRSVTCSFKSVMERLTSRRKQQITDCGDRSTNHDDLRVENDCQGRQSTTERLTDGPISVYRRRIPGKRWTEQVQAGWWLASCLGGDGPIGLLANDLPGESIKTPTRGQRLPAAAVAAGAEISIGVHNNVAELAGKSIASIHLSVGDDSAPDPRTKGQHDSMVIAGGRSEGGFGERPEVGVIVNDDG